MIGDLHAGVDAHLTSASFQVSLTDPLRIVVRHDYDFDRLPADIHSANGSGDIEISIDGGDWISANGYVVAGTSTFLGSSSGWRTDTLDFGTLLAGHALQFRWHAQIRPGYFEHFSHWAIARVQVQGATTPLFSRMVADTN